MLIILNRAPTSCASIVEKLIEHQKQADFLRIISRHTKCLMTLNTVYHKVYHLHTLFTQRNNFLQYGHRSQISTSTSVRLYIWQPPPQNQYSRQCDCFGSRLFPALCHMRLTATVSYVMLPRLSKVNVRKQLEGKQKNICPVQYTCKSGRVELWETYLSTQVKYTYLKAFLNTTIWGQHMM